MALRPPVPSRRARAYVAKMAIGQMTSTILIERPTVPAFDPNTGLTTRGDAQDIWSGPARIFGTRGTLTSIGEGLVSLGQTTIAIPQDAPLPKVDDVITVTASPDDPAIVGRHYRVIDVTEGGLLSPTRQLSVTTVEGNPWQS